MGEFGRSIHLSNASCLQVLKILILKDMKTVICIFVGVSLFFYSCKNNEDNQGNSLLIATWVLDSVKLSQDNFVRHFPDTLNNQISIKITDSSKAILKGYCNKGTANFIIDANRISFNNFSMSELICFGGGGIWESYLNELANVSAYKLEGQALRLTTHSNIDLFFSKIDKNEAIQAIGSFQGSADKEKWGDFNLVLELDKSFYSIGEPINLRSYLSNIGNKTIILNGILPYRQSANPPTIEVQLNDSLMFRTNNFLEKLNNEKDIVVQPGKKVELNKFNLLNAEGQLMILKKGTNLYQSTYASTIDDLLKEGRYKIHAFFQPTPQIYWSITDTMEFVIE